MLSILQSALPRLPKWALAVLALVACQERSPIVNHQVCGQLCHPDKVIAGVGGCKLGYYECEEGMEPYCADYGTPAAETCDGVDNDCNGQVDDSVLRPCTNSCGTGWEVCSQGHWELCSAPVPAPETCDGKDNDCDGIIDNPDQLLTVVCYTGPESSMQFGECHPGVLRCVNGVPRCANEKTPTYETCDGKDNDCDGQIDENVVPPNRKVDIVFILDESGSMESVLTRVANVAQTWALKYGNRTDLRFALVAAPYAMSFYDGIVLLIEDFTSAASIKAALSAQTSTNVALEPTYDALYMLAEPTNLLNLSWRNGSRHVAVLFSDEQGQSYEYDPPLTTDEVAMEAQIGGLRVYPFVNTTVAYSFQPIADASGGRLLSLYLQDTDMERELDTILMESACQ